MKPLDLQLEALEERVAPTIVVVNPAGNSPEGLGALNGEAIEAQNPAGYAPPGQQTPDAGAGSF